MRYIFYCIYNTQYLDGKNKKNRTPWFDALGLMLAGSLGWVGLIIEIIYFYVFNKNFPSASLAVIVTICFLLAYVHFSFFIKDRKYEKIYERYKSINNVGRPQEKWICLTYVFVPFLLGMLIAITWHKSMAF